MYLNEFTKVVMDEIFDLNEGKKTTEQAIFNLNKAIDDFSERVTSRDDIARYTRRYIRKHFSPLFPSATVVAEALTCDARNRSALHLINLCEEIGSVAESNGGFTFSLALRLSGRVVEEMTVGDLLAAVRDHNESYNRIHQADV